MIIDLIMLSIIGFVLEMLLIRFLPGLVLPGTAFVFTSLLVLFMAVTRWNLWGLFIIPIICLAPMIGGIWMDSQKLRDIYSFQYDWPLYVSMVIGYLSLGINVLFYKKNTKKIISSPLKMIGLLILDYIMFTIIQFIAYRLLSNGGNILHRGQLLNSFGDDYICQNIENGGLYNLFGLTIAIIGSLVLRSQGAIVNVKQKLIDDKRNAELDRIDMDFRIEELPVDDNQQNYSDDKSNNSSSNEEQKVE